MEKAKNPMRFNHIKWWGGELDRARRERGQLKALERRGEGGELEVTEIDRERKRKREVEHP